MPDDEILRDSLPSKIRRSRGLLLIVSVGFLVLLAACARGKAEGPQGPPTMPVKVQRVGSQEIGNTSEYVATIKSRNSATIMSDVEGWIFAINVKSGDLVKKGDRKSVV